MSKVYLVTGASGFIGSAVIARLAARGEPVTAVSRRTVPPRNGIVTRTVSSYAEVKPESEDTVLIHLAESRDATATASGVDPNESPAAQLLAALMKHRWRHVLYASSAVVYGDGHPYPRRTDEAVAPTSDYARVKFACERRVAQANGTVMRLSNVYGPGMACNSVISDILSQIPGTQPLRVRDLTPVRDFLWIDDAAAGIAALATARPAGIHNLSTGRGISVGTLAKTALSVAGEPDRPVTATRPSGRPSHITLDPTTTRTVCGWAAAVSVEDGLARLLERS